MATELSLDVASSEMSPTLPLTFDSAAVENCVILAWFVFLYCHSVVVETSVVLLVVLLLHRLTLRGSLSMCAVGPASVSFTVPGFSALSDNTRTRP